VPDGTQVKFVRTSGTGGALSAATASTTGGVATVTLTSAVNATGIVITATAGGVSANTAALAFANPNDPGTILLTANPTTGGINGAVPVTLTATVTPADPVNGVIANGTVVTFSILSGTGGAITAVTTTTGGVATATLNSTVANTISVNASAGTATSNTVPVQFIVQPVTATVKVATTGTLPVGTRIGGVDFTVTQTATGLTIADADVAASGTALGSLAQPNTTNPAAVRVALISTAGFVPTGEVATLVYHIPAGQFPTAANFSVALSGAGVIDTNGAAIPGIGIALQSVTIQ
jgi:adhesin/invasin